LLERELDAIGKGERLKKTDSDERLYEEGDSLFTDIYAKISGVGCVINAVREWGRRSFRILKLGTEIINFFLDNSFLVDVRRHFISCGGIALYNNLQEYLGGLSTINVDVRNVLEISNYLLKCTQ